MYFSSWQTMKMVSVVLLLVTRPNCISSMYHFADVEVKHPFQQFHDSICKLETTTIATVKGFTLAFAEIQDEALLTVCWNLTTAENNLHQLLCQLNSFLTSSFQHVSYDARWATSRVLCWSGLRTYREGTGSWRELKKLIVWALKLDIEQSSTVLNP